jgi:hypothetical protein
MSSGIFAFGPSAVVCSDGKELLAYAPTDEAPLWKKALSAPVAAVALVGDHVLAIDARGALVRLAADTGVEESKETFVGEPRAIAAGAGAVFAVALEDSVVVVDGDARVTLPIAGAQALAFSAKLLAVGTEAGKLRVVDGEATVAEADLGGAVRGVVRHPGGFWLATAKDTLFRVTDDGEATPFLRASGRAPSAVACSKDGALVAVQTAGGQVTVLAYPSKETLLSATYPERTAVGVALTADARFLWIGIDKGDANKVDLDEHDIYRTDPHPGRARAAWVLKVQIDKGVRARAKAQPAGAAKAKAPAEPIVKTPAVATETATPPQAEAPREAEADWTGAPEPELPPSSAAQKRLVLAVLFAATFAGVVSLFIGR